MSAEDAATLIMSAGVVQPGSDPQKKIAALAGMANAARVANASGAAAGAGKGGLSNKRRHSGTRRRREPGISRFRVCASRIPE